ncbi:MAG: cupredoxin domain-containing protein [Ferruginibacter sp.]|nr:cupredoxin domain-containing protein [Ferruginibacter sp.]
MKSLKFILPALLIGFISFGTISCSRSDDYNLPGSDTAIYKVNIQANQFSPSGITMLPANKITWTNMDTDTHSIVSDDGISFNSGNIPSGASYSFIPSATGTYTYKCGIHPAVQGVVYVVTR